MLEVSRFRWFLMEFHFHVHARHIFHGNRHEASQQFSLQQSRASHRIVAPSFLTVQLVVSLRTIAPATQCRMHVSRIGKIFTPRSRQTISSGQPSASADGKDFLSNLPEEFSWLQLAVSGQVNETRVNRNVSRENLSPSSYLCRNFIPESWMVVTSFSFVQRLLFKFFEPYFNSSIMISKFSSIFLYHVFLDNVHQNWSLFPAVCFVNCEEREGYG